MHTAIRWPTVRESVSAGQDCARWRRRLGFSEPASRKHQNFLTNAAGWDLPVMGIEAAKGPFDL